ncbi:hypothetical protein DYB36_004435 [Aphanomyces astaci]|uniref:FYVE-type domain-containing protein n=1 Tax=Aphanomyces astaci TaxID=112090 RepID=A0A397AWV5_APHAT|nr:hypothetical protein DYB36_004435 [Aphanomyces astaci]
MLLYPPYIIMRFCAREVVVMSKFPVPQDFIYCPPLGKDERANLVNLGENSLIDLVRSSKLHSGAIKWTMDSDENGIQIFHGEDPNGPTEVTLLAGVTEVLATFDEIAALFRQETKEAYAEYTKLFAKDTLDSAHLYTISTATPDRPRHFMGVRWVVIGSPYPLLANRDLCYLECQDDFEINGKRGWGRSMTSISLPCCPDFEGHLGTIRATFIRSGFVVHESKRPGYLQVIHALQIDLKGRVPQWVVKIGMKKRARSIGDFDKYLREKRLSAKPYLRDQDLVPKSSRFKCFLCQSKFGTFSTKVRCRKCGEVVCGKCNKFWQVKTTNAGRKMIRVCSACSITGGGHDGYPKDGVASSVAVSGVASSSEYSGIVQQPLQAQGEYSHGSKPADERHEDDNDNDDRLFITRESDDDNDAMSAYSEYSHAAPPLAKLVYPSRHINPLGAVMVEGDLLGDTDLLLLPTWQSTATNYGHPTINYCKDSRSPLNDDDMTSSLSTLECTTPTVRTYTAAVGGWTTSVDTSVIMVLLTMAPIPSLLLHLAGWKVEGFIPTIPVIQEIIFPVTIQWKGVTFLLTPDIFAWRLVTHVESTLEADRMTPETLTIVETLPTTSMGKFPVRNSRPWLLGTRRSSSSPVIPGGMPAIPVTTNRNIPVNTIGIPGILPEIHESTTTGSTTTPNNNNSIMTANFPRQTPVHSSESIIQDEVLRAMKALKGEETPDPQQLLALYKQLQQLNLEGTAPTTSA